MSMDKLRRLWLQDQVAINAWLSIPSSWTAEIFAHAGFDAITIDTQHGLMDFRTTLSMLQAMQGGDATLLARVSWNEPGAIMRLLDAGVAGVVCPMINNRADAEAFVGACRYPPLGYRSYGPIRAELVFGKSYFEQANKTVITLAMIETAQGLENLEEIATTPGLTGLYVGTMDLSISLGLSEPGNLAQPQLREALRKILAVANEYRLVTGVHCRVPDDSKWLIGQGFKLITPANDTTLLREAARHTVLQTNSKP